MLDLRTIYNAIYDVASKDFKYYVQSQC